MKKACIWSITAIGLLCLVFYAGLFTGRQSVTYHSTSKNDTTASTSVTNKTLYQELININTADADLLQTLPGIGETLAQRIIDYRQQNGPFSNVRQLEMVDGIGEGKMLEIIQMICTED